MAVIIIMGLPGTGKSTIASKLITQLDQSTLISTDLVRRELFGSYYGTEKEAEIYIEENIQLIYDVINVVSKTVCRECLLIVDGTYHKMARRDDLIDILTTAQKTYHFFVLRTKKNIIEQRLTSRSADHTSDARIKEYQMLRVEYEEPSPEDPDYTFISTDNEVDTSVSDIFSTIMDLL